MQKIFLWAALPLAAFFTTGCMIQVPEYRPIFTSSNAPKPTQKRVDKPAKPPKKKTYKIKEVQDDNFDPDYMYPDTPKKHYKEPETVAKESTVSAMSKEECIDMIGQTKYDKYIQMLGSESAAIKRCILLKSMK